VFVDRYASRAAYGAMLAHRASARTFRQRRDGAGRLPVRLSGKADGFGGSGDDLGPDPAAFACVGLVSGADEAPSPVAPPGEPGDESG